jgi:hypothetical protein
MNPKVKGFLKDEGGRMRDEKAETVPAFQSPSRL